MIMNIKIGDRVRYLNNVGGGKVTRIKSRNEVWVLEDDGFEVPARISELVVVNPSDFYFKDGSEAKASRKNESVENLAASAAVNYEPEAENYVFDESEETADGEKLSIYITFIPDDVKNFAESGFDAYLVNDSNYYLDFQWMSGGDTANVLKKDTVEPLTTLLLHKFSKADINGLESQRFQAIAYKKRPFGPKPSIDISFGVKPVKFYKIHCFTENDYFDEPAMLLPLVERDVFNLAMQVDVETVRNMIVQKNEPSDRKRIFKKKNKAADEALEIDLHINSLLDDIIGMSPKEMLDYQIDKFNEVMRQNLKSKGKRIVFIHGKGDGVLRGEIIKQLRQKYPNCQYQDASFQKYGFGATMVIIR